MGFWESDALNAGQQDTNFNLFVFGNPSADSAIPRIGSARFVTEVYGLTSQIGKTPIAFAGSGDTNIDLTEGTFSTLVTVEEDYLLTDEGRFGGTFSASGKLASGNGTFAGNFEYDGSQDAVAGALQGAFYGPGANEIGATFYGDNGSGNTVAGGFLGIRDGDPAGNLTLRDLAFDQLFYTGAVDLEFRDRGPGYSSYSINNNQFTYDADTEGYRVTGFIEAEGLFLPSSKITGGDTAFDHYRITYDGAPIELSLYKLIGGQVELTYSSFGDYFRAYKSGDLTLNTHRWFMYGLDTPEGVLSGRTGTGIYTGVAYGNAGSSDGARQLDVRGTSRFMIDFSNASYSGWLRLAGTDRSDGSTLDFGQIDLVTGTAIGRNAFTAGLGGASVDQGQIQLRFYGPTGEELSGVYGFTTKDGYVVGGATASVRN